ncbi:hypothetical protein VNO80_02348 [Phaseolus coccineus]|uniref:Uncharacterized protein n=1 Tax=Phaseolus coccineus TaxID=3886 RepID=A0AAN9NWJ4_PHACN
MLSLVDTLHQLRTTLSMISLFTTTHVKVTMSQAGTHEPLQMPICAYDFANQMSSTFAAMGMCSRLTFIGHQINDQMKALHLITGERSQTKSLPHFYAFGNAA